MSSCMNELELIHLSRGELQAPITLQREKLIIQPFLTRIEGSRKLTHKFGSL